MIKIQFRFATTAWDYPQDLRNLGVDLGFGDFDVRSWDFFTVVNEIKFLSVSDDLRPQI